jgi:hypothetical protein
METFPLAMILSNRASRQEAWSALPDAPVVLERPRRAPRPSIAARPRTALAHGLERLAAAVAPAPPACTPVS